MRPILAKDLIPILEELMRKHGDTLGVECNKVRNFIVSDEHTNLGYIDLTQSTYVPFEDRYDTTQDSS